MLYCKKCDNKHNDKPKKDKNSLTSYRPINNLCIIEKLLEHVIKQQILKFRLEILKVLEEIGRISQSLVFLTF